MTGEETTSESVITRGQSLFIASSSIISAATTFAVTWLASRTLSVSDNKEFLVFWSLLSLVFATLLGVQQESARLVGSRRVDARGEAAGVRPIVVAAGVGVLVAVVIAACSPYLMSNVLSMHAGASMLLVLAGAVAYACHAYFIGAMAGLKAWTEYGLLISTGGVFVLLGSLTAAWLSPTVFSFQVAFAASALLWLVFLLFSARVRAAATLRGEDSAPVVFKSMLWTLLTALAMAAISTGFPVFLEATSQTATPEQAALLAALILGISITRAPIMIPLQAFQGVAISHFLAQKDSPLKALVKPVVVFVGVGAIGGAAAFVMGPFLFDWIYPTYAGQLSGLMLGILTFAAALLALTTLSGTLALALNKHRLYLAGWLATVAVAFACLAVDTDLLMKTSLSLLLAPVTGFITHVWGILHAKVS